MSQAEHTGLFFEAAAGTKFIGSQTAGANGDVTNLSLPGGLYVSFSGHDVRHADGRQLQRVGLVPDVQVRPTLYGIRAGRDEVLDRALAYLRTGRYLLRRPGSSALRLVVPSLLRGCRPRRDHASRHRVLRAASATGSDSLDGPRCTHGRHHGRGIATTLSPYTTSSASSPSRPTWSAARRPSRRMSSFSRTRCDRTFPSSVDAHTRTRSNISIAQAIAARASFCRDAAPPPRSPDGVADHRRVRRRVDLEVHRADHAPFKHDGEGRRSVPRFRHVRGDERLGVRAREWLRNVWRNRANSTSSR